jgi:hypothetical protein
MTSWQWPMHAQQQKSATLAHFPTPYIIFTNITAMFLLSVLQQVGPCWACHHTHCHSGKGVGG